MKNTTEKRNRLMTAAAALFAKQGYKKTSIDEIVEKAGISKGLFYHYFQNKKELYIGLYNAYVDVLSECIRSEVDITETDFFERLRQVARIRIDFIRKHPYLWDFLYAAYYEEHTDVAPHIKEKNAALLRGSYAGSAANIDWSKLRKGMSPDKALELVTWVAEGFVKKMRNEALPDSECYDAFDSYIDCLKTGMYGGG